jgi:hypothetical protein
MRVRCDFLSEKAPPGSRLDEGTHAISSRTRGAGSDAGARHQFRIQFHRRRRLALDLLGELSQGECVTSTAVCGGVVRVSGNSLVMAAAFSCIACATPFQAVSSSAVIFSALRGLVIGLPVGHSRGRQLNWCVRGVIGASRGHRTGENRSTHQRRDGNRARQRRRYGNRMVKNDIVGVLSLSLEAGLSSFWQSPRRSGPLAPAPRRTEQALRPFCNSGCKCTRIERGA